VQPCYKATVNEPETIIEAKPQHGAGFVRGLPVPPGTSIERS
jgi:hypothetical protein